jgi:hypothetical protein
MAIISIPSSIGGISIPGTATNGPLGLLFNNPFGQTNLQYPRDLQSSARGHYVTFLIKDIIPIGYESDASYSLSSAVSGLIDKVLPASAGQATTNAALSALDPSADGSAIMNAVENNTAPAVAVKEELKLAPQKYADRGSISLYIPETMNFQYGMSYNDVSLTGVIGKAVGTALGVVGDVIGSKIKKADSSIGQALGGLKNIASADAAKLILKEGGLAINPKLQLLFEGIGFRSYQMAFTFTPYSQQEAEQVTKIINTFKQYAAPRLVNGDIGGMFFIPPAVFQPKFYFNGQENKKINAVAESVITNIDVNYGPNGWATFNDGGPVQTTLTLQFKETVILDRKALVDGNY